MEVAPPRPRNMVLPGLRGSYKRMIHGDEGVDLGREHGGGNGKYLFAC